MTGYLQKCALNRSGFSIAILLFLNRYRRHSSLSGWIGIEKNSLSIVRLVVLPNCRSRTTSKTCASQSRNSEMKSVLSTKVRPLFTIASKCSDQGEPSGHDSCHLSPCCSPNHCHDWSCKPISKIYLIRTFINDYD